jgi:Flp pilus assembly protein TadD
VAPPPQRRWTLVAAALLAAGVMASYASGLRAPFVYDDRGTVTDNPTIERLWSADVLSAPHETPTAGRPVVNVSFAVNYALGGRDVVGYHLGNIVIHLLCALTLFGIARRSEMRPGGALAIALIWAAHPLNSEAVNYVTQRTESLMGLFYLLTLYCAIRAAETPHSKGRWEAAAVLACLLGMASKESMVTAPLAVVLYDRIFRFGSLSAAFRARGRLYAGLALTWALLAVLVASAPRNLSAGFSAHDADVGTYALNQAVMITRYLRLAIWPTDLVLYYGWPQPLTLSQVLRQGLLVVGLLVLTAAALARARRLGFLGVWFFLTLAPTSSLLPIATEVGAERRMYLPLMAIVALVVIGYRWLIIDQRWRAAGLAITAVALTAGTIARTSEYQSSLRLAETTVERWPTPGGHSMLGTELAAAGRFAEAERHLREATAVHPPAQYYLATVLAAQGKGEEAIPHFQAFIRSQPPELDQVMLARGLLGDALVKDGRYDEAAQEFRAILARSEDPEAAVQLAQIYMRQGRHQDAIPLFERALTVRPDDSRTLGSLGVALASMGQLEKAIATFERALAVDPRNTNARANLARALAMRR